MSDESIKASVVPVWLLFRPADDFTGVSARQRKDLSLHRSENGAMLAQDLTGEVKTQIEPRLGAQLEAGGIFLIQGSGPWGIQDEDSLKEQVKDKALSSLSNAQKIALGLPLSKPVSSE